MSPPYAGHCSGNSSPTRAIALTAALDDEKAMNLIRVHIGLDDRSQMLDRLAAGLARRVRR